MAAVLNPMEHIARLCWNVQLLFGPSVAYITACRAIQRSDHLPRHQKSRVAAGPSVAGEVVDIHDDLREASSNTSGVHTMRECMVSPLPLPPRAAFPQAASSLRRVSIQVGAAGGCLYSHGSEM